MPGLSFDSATLAFVVAGALVAGFTTGFAGFGTGLVASGFWFHVPPAAAVPPLVALASVAGQIVGLVTVRSAFDWKRTLPFLIGGAIGIPLGVAVLAQDVGGRFSRGLFALPTAGAAPARDRSLGRTLGRRHDRDGRRLSRRLRRIVGAASGNVAPAARRFDRQPARDL